MSAAFVFTACQVGSEATLKQEIARRHPAFRFAFSRPGFCTFRVPRATDDSDLRVTATFARTWGVSLGRVGGTNQSELANAAAALIDELAPQSVRHVHVWRRDQALPGDLGFDAKST